MSGARPSDQALVPTASSPQSTKGFDPSRYHLRRGRRGVRRIERSDSWYGGWIARGVDGYRLPWGDSFEWRTRQCAWTVCWEDDFFGGVERRAASGMEAATAGETGTGSTEGDSPVGEAETPK